LDIDGRRNGVEKAERGEIFLVGGTGNRIKKVRGRGEEKAATSTRNRENLYVLRGKKRTANGDKGGRTMVWQFLGREKRRTMRVGRAMVNREGRSA